MPWSTAAVSQTTNFRLWQRGTVSISLSNKMQLQSRIAVPGWPSLVRNLQPSPIGASTALILRRSCGTPRRRVFISERTLPLALRAPGVVST